MAGVGLFAGGDGVCGIAGLVRPAGPPVQREVHAMGERIRHRGTDGAASAAGRHWGMAVCWPGAGAALDVRLSGVSEDGRIHAVCTGAIDNRLELRTFLTRRGHRLQSGDAGEVLVHLYEEEGPALARRLAGPFAFALWDEGRRRLLLGRDPMGQKSLYVFERGHTIAFASEIKALAEVREFAPRPQGRWLPVYLTQRLVPAPHTLLEGVQKVEPGALWMRDAGRPWQRWRYWEPPLAPPRAPTDSLEAWVERLDGLLGRVVAQQLARDEAWGLALSGGVDSSLVAALAAAAGRPVPVAWTLSWGEAAPRFQEVGASRRAAAWLGIPLRVATVGADALPARLAHLALVLDEPMGDPTALALDGLVEQAAGEVRLMLTGEGADEVFGGRVDFGTATNRGPRWAIPTWLRRVWSGAGLAGGETWPPGGTALAGRRRRPGLAFSSAELARLLVPELLGPEHSPEMEAYWAGAQALPELQQLQGYYLRWFLPDGGLWKLDRIGMAHRVALRSPYCDHRVVELSLAIPLKWRRVAGVDKRVLRRVARRYLPGDWVYRKRRDVPTPLTLVLLPALVALGQELWTGSQREWFRPEGLRSLLAAAAAALRGGSGEWGSPPTLARKMYALVMLELWLREMAEGQLRLRPSIAGGPTVLA